MKGIHEWTGSYQVAWHWVLCLTRKALIDIQSDLLHPIYSQFIVQLKCSV